MPIGPGSFTQLPPNSTGPKLATGPAYTENAQTVQDEKVLLGEPYLASYTVTTFNGASTATAASHLLQIMAGASLIVRIRRIELYQASAATTAAIMSTELVRLTTAGTGGTVYTPTRLDPADAVSGATVMTLPTVKGTEGNRMLSAYPTMWQTIAAGSAFPSPSLVWDFDRLRSKPLLIAAGVANGIAIKNNAGIAAGVVTINVWFDEASWA